MTEFTPIVEPTAWVELRSNADGRTMVYGHTDPERVVGFAVMRLERDDCTLVQVQPPELSREIQSDLAYAILRNYQPLRQLR
jgi:hypothetical protein